MQRETLHYCHCVSPLILELNISETSECANISAAAVARCEGLTRVRAVFVRQLIGPPPRMWLLTKQSYPTPVVLTVCGTLSSEKGQLLQPLALLLSKGMVDMLTETSSGPNSMMLFCPFLTFQMHNVGWLPFLSQRAINHWRPHIHAAELPVHWGIYFHTILDGN